MDVLIIGSGISGSVVARRLAEQGKKVVIWERRDHLCGNMYDYIDKHGILVHKYGPHTFHTQNKKLYDFILKYGEWVDYKLVCGAEIKGKISPVPFNFSTIDMYYEKDKAEILKHELIKEFSSRGHITVLEALNSNNFIIKEYADFLFEYDYKPYTSKQWGISPDKIDSSILKRVPLNLSYDDRYFKDDFQVMPKISYENFFNNLLDHDNIHVVLNKEALDEIKIIDNSIYLNEKFIDIPVVYTGALDELFDYKFGKLPYRTLLFKWFYEKIKSKQKYPVVAYPMHDKFTRITEYKKLPYQNVAGTTFAVEYPSAYSKKNKDEPYYPVLTLESQQIYQQYLDKANKIHNLYIVGRLANFKYYNMDQALEQALILSDKIIKDLYE